MSGFGSLSSHESTQTTKLRLIIKAWPLYLNDALSGRICQFKKFLAHGGNFQYI